MAQVYEPRPYFGISLSTIVEREKSEVPMMILKCTEYLEKKALDEEGILRLSGSTVEIQEIRDKIDQGIFDFTGRDPHAVAGILKSFFRELPEGIISQEINDGVAAVFTYGEGQELIEELKNIFDSLPKPNFYLLKHLISFLVKVAAHSDKNKMNTNNLLRVMTPTLNIVPGIISIAMENFDYMFAVPTSSDEQKKEEKPDGEKRKKKKHHKHKDKDADSKDTKEKKHKKEKKSKKKEEGSTDNEEKKETDPEKKEKKERSKERESPRENGSSEKLEKKEKKHKKHKEHKERKEKKSKKSKEDKEKSEGQSTSENQEKPTESTSENKEQQTNENKEKPAEPSTQESKEPNENKDNQTKPEETKPSPQSTEQ